MIVLLGAPARAARTRAPLAAVLPLVAALLLSACGGDAATQPATVHVNPTADPAVVEPVPEHLRTPTPSPALAPDATATPATTLADEPANEQASGLTALPTASPVDPAAALTDFQTRAGELVAGVDGLVEVVVRQPDGETLFETNAGEPMEAASLYKLPVLVEVFRLRDAGVITFDQPLELSPDYFMEEDSVYGEESIGAFVEIGTLVENMVTLSSNVAAKALLAMAGTEQVNATMASLGLVNTEIRWSPGFVGVPEGNASRALARVAPPPGEDAAGNDPRADEALNVTTAADMAALFSLLVTGEIVSPEASAEMLDILSRQQINDRLPAYLPEGTTVAHKTGNLDGLVHDVGVIWAPAGPVVVVVLTETWDEGAAIELIRELAAGAYALGE